MIPRMLAVLLLGVVYILMLGSLDPRDLLFGVVVGGLLVWWRTRGRPPDPLTFRQFARRAVAFPRFALAIFRSIVAGTWQMSLIVLRLRPSDRGGIIVVPMAGRSASAAIMHGFVETLSPGSVLVEFDWADRLMLIHVMDASDPVAQVRQRQEFYERYQRAVFP